MTLPGGEESWPYAEYRPKSVAEEGGLARARTMTDHQPHFEEDLS